MSEKPRDVIVGDGQCPRCDHPITIKATKSGHLCYTCPAPADGGCGHQHFDRYARSDEFTARNVVKKWRKPEFKAAFIPDAKPAPGKRAKPDPDPDPVPKAESYDERVKREMGW